ncbi:hypothetical protein HDZ31DRAFT_38867 [Schizophyllum fasciatum]
MSECSPAREVVIVLQEALEHLSFRFEYDAEDDEHRELCASLIQIMDLYAAVIPRLKLRRKTPTETIDPLLLQITRVVSLASANSGRDDGRKIILATVELANSSLRWAQSLDIDPAAISSAKQSVARALEDVLSSCSASIQSALSQRTFNALFPRLARMSGPLPPGWEDGAAVVDSALASFRASEGLPSLSRPSIGALVLSSHSKDTPSPTALSSAMPALITSLQTNVALDESLALLLRILTLPNLTLGPDQLFPLSTLLPTVASLHPDPSTRHISFRILSLLLRAAPSHLRLDILRELTTDESLPQMMVAAISLVKEAFLDGLDTGSPSVFGSKAALQELGAAVLQTHPPDALANTDKAKFLDSVEPRRLTEVLSLLYVLLRRDAENRTGIRDRDTIRAMETNILAPLRARLADWMEPDAGEEGGHEHDMMSLVALSISLERVDSTLAELQAA